MSSVVLITGVSRFLGGRLAAQLAADPSIERVIGVDTVAPATRDLTGLGRTEFVRADIRNPLIAKVIAQAGVTTVVHAGVMNSPRLVGGRVPMQEMNVIGTMQLLGACQKSDTVSRVVVASTSAVYGSGSRSPAIFTESMHPGDAAHAGYARDAVEIEGYVRGFTRRRPDIETTVLRFANTIGPTIDTALTRYLAMPVIPTAIGFDPRLQLLHEADAIETARRAAVTAHPGVFNVAADGVMALSQIVRRLGKLRLPVPSAAVGAVGSIVRNSGVIEFSAEQAQFLSYGRVVDTTKLHTEFGYQPRFTTAETLEDYLTEQRQLPRPALAGLVAGARLLQIRTAAGAST
jgi:UDP-glucose 4-epimerase